MGQPRRDSGSFAPGEAHGETDERFGRDSGGLSLAKSQARQPKRDSGGLSLAESHAGQPRRDSGGSAPGEGQAGSERNIEV